MTQQDDITQRLRDNADLDEAEHGNARVVQLEREAADEIERLRAELSQVRAPVADERAQDVDLPWLRAYMHHQIASDRWVVTADQARDFARAAVLADRQARDALASAPVADEQFKAAFPNGVLTAARFHELWESAGHNPNPDRTLLENLAWQVGKFAGLVAKEASAPVAGEAKNYPGDNVAERLDKMADGQPPGSQAQSDLYAAATIWRKHIAHRAAPQASAVAGEAQPVIHQHGFAADNQRLRAINESLDKQLEEVMAERDEYHDMADKLANAIADHLLIEIGEHSSSNCPWMRALEAIEHAAPQASAEDVRKPIMTVAEFCAEADRIGLTADTLAAQLAQRPEFADCLPPADKDGGQQRKRYVVLKSSRSRYAYVNDTQEGRSINRFDVLKADGWKYAHEFADRMNKEHERAALSATQAEQGERDA